MLEAKIDAFGTGIGAILLQEDKVVELFSEKLSEAKRKWYAYEHFYAMIRALKH